MMSHPFPLRAWPAILAAALCCVLIPSRASPDLGAQIDAALARQYKPRDPGATVIVVKDGATIFRKAYGMARLRPERRMQPEYSLRLGSITKQFTAAAILLLADEGKLALTDTLERVLPGFPAETARRVTVEHLLTHTSGLGEYSNKPGYSPHSNRNLSVQQVVDSFKHEPLLFEPGTNFAYSNSGYFLLGAIIEHASGMPYAQFLRERIFQPLDMHATFYEGEQNGRTYAATGYAYVERDFVPAPPVNMSLAYAAGALVSTVDDLARFDAAASAARLLKPATWQRAHASARLADGRPSGYGHAAIVANFQGTPSVSHGGGIDGFYGYVLRLPEHKVFVAVLSNADGGITPAHAAAFRAAAIVMGKPLPP